MGKDFKCENFDNLRTLTNKEHLLLVRVINSIKSELIVKMKKISKYRVT